MAILANRTAEVQSLFIEHLDRIQSIIRQRCWSEERRQNALCWAWEHFVRYLPNAECPRQAAVAAAVFACRARRTFGKEPRSGYQDAMDHRDNGAFQHPAIDERPTDRGWTIEDMPPRLQMVAKCLAFGLNRTDTAAKLGCCTYTVRRRVDEIAQWILDRQPGKYASRLDAA